MKSLLDYLFPPSCPCCDAEIGQHGGLCIPCWQRLHFISRPYCERCGIPFIEAAKPGSLCGQCIRKLPVYRRSRAVFMYETMAKQLIVLFKRLDRTDLAPLLARMMVDTGHTLLQEANLLIPVPLHPFRLFLRRYNQSALLTRLIAEHTQTPAQMNILKRRRATTSQVGLQQRIRLQNLRQAFSITHKDTQRIKGKKVVLIDDVQTTGATVSECTRTLLKAGAEYVDVLTLAKTALPTAAP